MKIHQLSVDEVLESLHTSRAGLSPREAARRLGEFGPNAVPHAARRRVIWRLLEEFTHFFAIILWLAAGLALLAERFEPGQGMGSLGLAIMGVIVINGVFSFWQVHRAEKALAELEKLLPRRVQVCRAGTFGEVPAEQLVPGDIISFEAGNLVSADCRLIEAFGVRVNNATVTGEALPKARSAAPCEQEDVLHADNVVLAGTTVVSGDARGVVYATGRHTEFGRIARLTQSAGGTTFPLQQEIRFVSRVVAVVATSLGVCFFLIGTWLGLSFWQNFLFGIGIIVANVPEGLLPTVTLALAMGAQRMARRNVLIRRLPAVETLGSATVICTDKTGTLTENRMHVRAVYVGGQLVDAREADGVAEALRGQPRFLEVLSACHNLKVTDRPGVDHLLGDPTEVALVELAERVWGALHEPPRLDEIPFDSDRKRLSTLHATAGGRVLYTKGALECVLPLCRYADGLTVFSQHADSELVACAGDGQPYPPRAPQELNEMQRRELLATQKHLAEEGLRVLAIAARDVPDDCPRDTWERELVLLGLVALDDPPRAEVPAAIASCRRAGIKVIMVTGDHPQTALGVARQIGLVQTARPRLITGDRLRRMSPSQLQLALGGDEIVFARVGADQKMRIVESLQQKGEIVAVTGDGVNDAPALAQADIGIAMGATGTDVARETADLVLADDNFANIVGAIEEGRAVFDNLRKFLTYILSSNVPELIPFLAFVLLRIPLPLTILQILAVDLGTDIVPALALGAEPPDTGVMDRPPRPRSQRLLTWPLLARAYGFLGMFEAVGSMAAYAWVMWGAGWRFGESMLPGDARYGAYRQATTACLAGIVVLQVVNLMLCRSETLSVFARRVGAKRPANRLLAVGIGVELVLLAAIVYTPWGQRIFQTGPLSGGVWLSLLPFALLMLSGEELRKAVMRQWHRGGPAPSAAGEPSADGART